MSLKTALRVFGDETITPTEDVLERGHLVFDQLVRVILEKSKTRIARVAKNGSVAKKTAIGIKVDFDCMFFIDQEVLPMGRYNEFIDDVQDILTLNLSSDHIHASNSSVTYFYKGYYFDFLPAPYAANAGNTVEAQIKHRIQHPLSTVGLGRCRGDQALAEGTVVFFKGAVRIRALPCTAAQMVERICLCPWILQWAIISDGDVRRSCCTRRE